MGNCEPLADRHGRRMVGSAPLSRGFLATVEGCGARRLEGLVIGRRAHRVFPLPEAMKYRLFYGRLSSKSAILEGTRGCLSFAGTNGIVFEKLLQAIRLVNQYNRGKIYLRGSVRQSCNIDILDLPLHTNEQCGTVCKTGADALLSCDNQTLYRYTSMKVKNRNATGHLCDLVRGG